MKYTKKEIEKVFRKLKSYSYYDNFFLFLRERIASFEAENNFESKLDELVAFLNTNTPLEESNYFKELLSNIDYVVIPKKFEHDKIDDSEDFIITNKFSNEHYNVESCNYLIDAPIEIHLVSLLWILNEGVCLNDTYKKNNYAYALELDESKSKVGSIQ
ncbi:hypothetical protein [Ochrovirga pacifica]|uniref:hypothetical protein n=1 Tax=Ochrovirga pacifica TaxID=1042376 RepID=UPI000255A069|nr:hypothetical protein [Ochrovirga pacifica]